MRSSLFRDQDTVHLWPDIFFHEASFKNVFFKVQQENNVFLLTTLLMLHSLPEVL